MPSTKLRILIVDSNPAVPQDLRRILANHPAGPTETGDAAATTFVIEDASESAEALDKVIQAGFAGEPFAIVFVDVRAPLGLESIAQLWKQDPALQVIACATAFDFSWEAIAARLGVHGDLLVLRKPFASVEVLQMVHTLAKKWRAARTRPDARQVEPLTLLEAQKLEAVSQLAGGVAHDFNNMLTIIRGHASLQLASGRHDPGTASAFGEIARAAERAAELTRQLLAFSQRQVLLPRVLRLNSFIGEIAPRLRELAGERIDLRLALADDLPLIWCDPAGIEQIVVALVTNARDAMPEGGGVTIATRAEKVGGRAVVQNPEAKPGDYVRLSVIDTGGGMDERTIDRIFEPFFTTKQAEKGTGMGLAAAHGIARQHGGWIEVVSAPGDGAAFAIFLPVTQRIAEADGPPDKVAPAAKAILLVEDDDAVRSLVKEMIEQEGYRVLEAASAEAALKVWEEHAPEIGLLFTDMVMPGGAGGLELSRQLLALQPELRVIYTSGYSPELFTADLQLTAGVNYLPKPYLSQQLAAILRKALA
jgi:signal transduction histidine kinase